MSPIERENMQLKERASDVELENATLRARIAELEKERDDFHMAYRTKVDEETKQLSLEVIRHCKTIDALQARIAELEKELERERMRLAACGTAALGYFDGCIDEYKSASLDDVLRLRADLSRERELRRAAQLDAERYRWLRNDAYHAGAGMNGKMVWCVIGEGCSTVTPIFGEELDAAIQASKTDSDQKGEG